VAVLVVAVLIRWWPDLPLLLRQRTPSAPDASGRSRTWDRKSLQR
jgi:hypothetical protein